MTFVDGHLQRVANQFGNEYGDFVTAEKLGVGPHMPVLEALGLSAGDADRSPIRMQGMKQASAQ